jgi:hypothetical protein
MIDCGNGWYRCWIAQTATATNNASNQLIRLSGVSDSIYAWGYQVEIGTSPTPYQGVGATNTLVPTSFSKREDNTGSIYVKDKFDEVTGMIATNGLVAYYDAGKAASQPATGATWYDISDRRNNATVVSASPPTYNSAGYFTFDRVNSQRFATSALAPTTWAEPWSIEVWMYTPTGATWSNGTNDSHFISVGSTAGTWGVVRYRTNNQINAWIRGAAEQIGSPQATLARDRWNQFVGTWDGASTVSSYLNGAFVGSNTINPTGVPDTGSVVIGGATGTISGSPGTFYEGNIAAVMMYNRALSLAEVTNNFEALRGRFGI